MKIETLYSAKSMNIGKVVDSTSDYFGNYFLDIIEKNGNQQTICVGSMDDIISFIKTVELS